MPSVLSLLKESLALYKKNFLSFLILITISFLLKLLLKAAGSSVIQLGLDYRVLMILALSLFASLWKSLAILYALKNQGAGIQVFSPYLKTIPKLAPFFIVNILMIFMMLGGFILLIIPAIILSIYLSFSSFTYFFEDLRGFDALSKSFEYVKGRWVSVAGRVILVFTISTIIYYLTSKILPSSFKIIFDYAFQIIFLPLGSIYYYLIYKSLVETYDSSNYSESAFQKRKKWLKAIFILGFIIFFALMALMIILDPKFFMEMLREK